MLKAEGFFRNSTDDDPTQHLRNFLGMCAMHKQNHVSNDALRLRVFKCSLTGDARKWIQNLPPNSIHTWPELVRAFLANRFPQSKKSGLRDKIFFFKQLLGEYLYEVWDRFKLYLARSPNHGFPYNILLEKFYMGLDPLNQSIVKNAADASFMDKIFARVTQILDKMAKHNQAWHSEDTTGEIAYVNVVEDVQPLSNEDYEEANYVNNAQGGYQRQPYQGSGQQNQWRSNPQRQGYQQWRNDQGNWSNNNNNYLNRSSNPYDPPKGQYCNSSHWKERSSSESKLENMLERVLQTQERSDTSMKNMTELVGSHTTSIQKLKMQMRDLSREQNPKQKGTLPSDTIANPKGNGNDSTSHYMAITTQSGKIIQGKKEQVVEVEDPEQEIEAQIEVPIVVEAKRLPKEVKIQEMNHEEVNEP
nr:uncharacterized protein LOC104086659 [Nicotiana tomentosiformis]